MEDAIFCLTAEDINEIKNNLTCFAVRLDGKTVQANIS
jgi:hypothetical protein